MRKGRSIDEVRFKNYAILKFTISDIKLFFFLDNA